MKHIDEISGSKLIVVVSFGGTSLINIAGPIDVFSYASKIIEERTGRKDSYEVVLASSGGALYITANSGIRLAAHSSVKDITRKIDTIIFSGAGSELRDRKEDPIYDWLRDKHSAIRRIASVCTGAFILARAGLLHNKRATTHWSFCKKLQNEFPDCAVEYGPFYVKDGNVYTSGGVSSGIDLALALVEEDFGREIALSAAKRLVLFLKRPGSQTQFGEMRPFAGSGGVLNKLGSWMMENIDGDLSVERLAGESAMSPRNFARVFSRETGMTPAKFVESIRVETARKMLEETDMNIEQIAGRCGLGGLVNIRRIFLRHLNLTPSDYRRMFKTSIG